MGRAIKAARIPHGMSRMPKAIAARSEVWSWSKAVQMVTTPVSSTANISRRSPPFQMWNIQKNIEMPMVGRIAKKKRKWLMGLPLSITAWKVSL